MDLLTWNLGKNGRDADLSFKALELVCDHLKGLQRRRVPFVAALQECPEDTDGVQKALPGSYVHGNVDRAIISSTPLVDLRDMDRFVAARTSVEGNDFAVISYHGVDRLRRGEPTQRGGRSSEFRWLMDDYCGMAPAIVMGDFNAQPKDPEIQSRWCFSFALDGDFHLKSHGRARSGFKVILPSNHRGTYYWEPEDTEDDWLLCDLLVTSEHLVPATSCEVSFDLAGESLVNNRGRPAISDHLPVLGRVDFTRGTAS